MELYEKKCVPCEGGTPPFVRAQIEEYLKRLPASWEVVGDKKLRKEFRFEDFGEAMKFVNGVAEIAETERHHPDLCVFYDLVKIELWTHAVGGLSENDFILASKIERLLK